MKRNMSWRNLKFLPTGGDESQAVTRYHEDQFAVTGLPPASVEKQLTRPPMPPAGGIPDEKTAIRLPAAPSSEKTIIAPPRRTPAG